MAGESNREPYGYLVSFGYRGWVEELGRFILFATEEEYKDYIFEGHRENVE